MHINREIINNLMVDAIDLHLHASPDRFPRRQTVIEVAQDAAKSKMKAIVIKNNDTLTADVAMIANEIVPEISIFGGIVLNRAVGGLNPYAVEIAALYGAKIVWMPSIDSAWTIENYKRNTLKLSNVYKTRLSDMEQFNGISIFDDGINGDEVRKEVFEILEIVKKNDMILDTCHLSPRETLKIIKLANEVGVKKVLCCHINSLVIGASIKDMIQYIENGAYLGFTITPCMPGRTGQPMEEIAKIIKEIGLQHWVITTDFGKEDNPPPTEGMYMSIAHLLHNGFSEKEVRLICNENPSKLLNLM